MTEDGDIIPDLLSECSKDEELFTEDANYADVLIRLDQAAEVLAPEDAAWADSCLAPISELSDDGWSALREALLDTLSRQSTTFETPTPIDDGRMQLDHDEVESPPIVRGDERFSSDGQDERNGDSAEEDIESFENIFRVWDLETQVDDDNELIKQLEKAPGERRLTIMPPPLDDQIEWKVDDQSEWEVDDLVTGLTDLSLEPLRH